MGADWDVRINSAVHKELRALPEAAREEAIDLIRDLAHDPFPPGLADPLRRNNRVYRQYFGADKFRLIYRVDHQHRTVEVFRARPRRTAYRGLRNP